MNEFNSAPARLGVNHMYLMSRNTKIGLAIDANCPGVVNDRVLVRNTPHLAGTPAINS